MVAKMRSLFDEVEEVRVPGMGVIVLEELRLPLLSKKSMVLRMISDERESG